ncbi:Cystathionine beta-synthase [Fragariocoptes setiger]|uniref:Cystathionine beta-synthase n=1 Tax=Fragariocoptes setiger TaxID=1670756 RepID=A0ABQ7S536_9ACAR|nr:Cystathionine beta-synthase [Fragariocoptes setiger]
MPVFTPVNQDYCAEAVGWPSKCLWAQKFENQRNGCEDQTDMKDVNPHNHITFVPTSVNKIVTSITDAIGNTPLVRLNRLPEKYGIECEIVAKCEFMNPGGSVKDRIAIRMIIEAENAGLIEPNAGWTLIEPTSGNTGIGLAMAAASRGYECIIVMPEKMSMEKESILRALGATIVRTRTSAAYKDSDSHINRAIELNKKIPKSIILNQYRHAGNPLAHYDASAEEILHACQDNVDVLVAGAGTGGTISGLARKFRERVPSCKIVAADPVGSLLAQPASLNEHKPEESAYDVEGIGYDFVPTVLDRGIVDKWVKTRDEASFTMARELIRLEGLLCGGSSGAAIVAAIKAAKYYELDKNHRIVVVLPDGVRNYMTKMISDDWMEQKGYTKTGLNATGMT